MAVEGDGMREHGRINVKVGEKHEETGQNATVVGGGKRLGMSNGF